MELTSDQSRGIKAFIQDWSKNATFELETSFGAGGVVDSNTFLQIAQRLRTKGFRVLAQEDYLNILTPNQVRFTLQGLGILQNYCKDNTLDGKIFSAMVKDRTYQQGNNIDIREYDIRVKMRREVELSKEDHRVADIISKWNTQQKAFRLIRRWSFEGKGIRVDLSMVRQSPSDAKGQFQWSTTFLERNILPEVPRYEVEVELLHNTEDTDTAEKALASLIRGMGEVQRAIQKNSLLIRTSVIQSVRKDYMELVGTDKFRGVGPVTLQVQNMIEQVEDGVPNVRTGYNVTDKADGLRALGYVNPKGELFLLDQSMNVYRTGLTNDACANSLVDGEWVTFTKEGEAINHYLIFDIYYYEQKAVSHLPFMTFKEHQPDLGSENRYSTMLKWDTDWKKDVQVAKGVTESNRLMVALKRFEFAEDRRIFLGCAQILNQNETRLYHTDGLILTSNSEPIPNKAGVRFNQQFKWKPAIDNTVDFLITYERNAEFSSLDQISNGIDPESNGDIRYKTMRLYVGSAKGAGNDNPRAVILDRLEIVKEREVDTKYKPNLFTPLDFQDTMANTCHVLVQRNPDTGEEYTVTEDTEEPIPNRSIVEMRYDPSREPGWRWIPARIRHDKTERLLRAMARGGTIKYSGMMNDEAVANSVWNSIHDPVTESMIRNGSEQPTELEMKDILKIRESDMGKKYYERKAPKENLVLIKGLQDFHNKYIKNELLLQNGLKGGNKTILDLACGKGGDLYKWINGQARYVMGVDYAADNITNPQDGAYKRYVEAIIKFRNRTLPQMVFAIGNSAKRIIDGEAGANPEERDILRSVFGRSEPEGPVPSYVQQVMAGTFRAGADLAACMFALHYFFKDEAMLGGFLRNLEETVKPGGLFMGCCFDGDKVFSLLRGVQKGHSKTGSEGDVPIWTITKEYDHDMLVPDETSVGLSINVEFISIGSAQREYLVSFEFLKKKMKEIGFRLLDEHECKELHLKESTNTFDVSYNMTAKKYPMPDAVKQFSFLNRWFIFKRDREQPDVPAIELEDVADLPSVKAEAPSAKPAVPSVKPLAKPAVPSVKAEAVPSAKPAVPSVPSVKPSEAKSMKKKVIEEEKKDDSVAPSVLPEASRTFTKAELFEFGSDVPDRDSLEIKDPFASKYMALIAPFPIPDPDDATLVYPSVDHFLAGMRIKHASNRPEQAVSLFGRGSQLHQAFLSKRRVGSIKSESPKDFELRTDEATEIRKRLTKTALASSKTVLDDAKWNQVKDRFLMEGLRYRWEHDQRFHTIVEAARNRGKYLLFTVSSTARNAFASELGGTRSMAAATAGQIVGQNKVGRFIMELAGFQF